jgi:adenine-specific DNA-methyltransferase
MKRITRTELVWVGKYDDEGNLRPVDRTILPFQVVETVNESKVDREKAQRDLFTLMPRDDTWRNMLIWGDNKVVMSSLLPRFAGKVNLIYIDPPFATGQDFSFRVRVGDEEFVKEPSIIEEKAYRDTWGRGLDSYLQMMYERLVLMRELLAEDGSIWVHLDEHVGHYVKAVLDEIFGYANFANQIIWHYPDNFQGNVNRYPNNHNFILVYVKTPGAGLHRQKEKLDQPIKRPTRVWDKDQGKLAVERDEEGKIIYQEFAERWLDDVWRIPQRPVVVPKALEYQGYPTQKPEKLLDLIVRSGSKLGDLVADFFCGSGTMLAVAEKLGRRWIGCDLSKWAIQVTRKRLLQIEGCKPFEILNLGNYERHKLAANGHWERYVQFILQLYRAEPVTGFTTLHGKKARAYVHVGSVDSPITMREIRQTLKEALGASVREVHFLGWDFEMGLHDLVSQVGEDHGVKVRLVSIPREALEVTNPAKEEVRFFDLNYLELEHEVKGRKATVRLKDFIIANPEYIPDEVREKIKKFTDYIDYWAVDWDYKDDTFHNGWQSYRTRKEPKLETEATHTYDQPGTYKVLVKVVDIFGNDTTKIVEIDIPEREV